MTWCDVCLSSSSIQTLNQISFLDLPPVLFQRRPPTWLIPRDSNSRTPWCRWTEWKWILQQHKMDWKCRQPHSRCCICQWVVVIERNKTSKRSNSILHDIFAIDDQHDKVRDDANQTTQSDYHNQLSRKLFDFLGVKGVKRHTTNRLNLLFASLVDEWTQSTTLQNTRYWHLPTLSQSRLRLVVRSLCGVI